MNLMTDKALEEMKALDTAEEKSELKLEKVTLLTQNALILAAERRGFEEGTKRQLQETDTQLQAKDEEMLHLRGLVDDFMKAGMSESIRIQAAERRGFEKAIALLRTADATFFEDEYLMESREWAAFLESKLTKLSSDGNVGEGE